MNAVNEHKKFGMAIEKWRVLMLAAFAVLAAGGFLCSVLSGAVAIPVSALGDILSGGGDNASRQILLNIRLPRAIVAALVGMNLAVSGAVLQAVMKNPLADPHIIGISSGAGLAGIFVIVLFPALEYLIVPTAFCGAMLAAACIYILAWLRRHACHSLHLHSGVEKRHPPAAYCAGRRCRIKLSGRGHFGHTCALQRQGTRRADVDGGRPCGTFMAPC